MEFHGIIAFLPFLSNTKAREVMLVVSLLLVRNSEDTQFIGPQYNRDFETTLILKT